jgi:hypothetical protein
MSLLAYNDAWLTEARSYIDIERGAGLGIRHRQNITQYFTVSNDLHVKMQWWTQVYQLSLFTLIMTYLLVVKRRQPALIAATGFFLFHGAFAVFYAYSNIGDAHLHKWLRQPENKAINTFLFMMCSVGYGFGMYIMVMR